MAKVKNIEAYCTFCGAVTKMELSKDAEVNFDENKRWVKCKKCKQTMALDLEEIEGGIKPKLKEIESENSRTYSPKESYKVGETIFHTAWNDLGIVIDKEVLTNGKRAILVEFQNSGSKKLLETISAEVKPEETPPAAAEQVTVEKSESDTEENKSEDNNLE